MNSNWWLSSNRVLISNCCLVILLDDLKGMVSKFLTRLELSKIGLITILYLLLRIGCSLVSVTVLPLSVLVKIRRISSKLPWILPPIDKNSMIKLAYIHYASRLLWRITLKSRRRNRHGKYVCGTLAPKGLTTLIVIYKWRLGEESTQFMWVEMEYLLILYCQSL